MELRGLLVLGLVAATLAACGGRSNLRDDPGLPDVEVVYEHDVFGSDDRVAYIEVPSSAHHRVEPYVAAAANEIAATQDEGLWYIELLCPSDDIESNRLSVGSAVFANGDTDVLDAGDYDIPENLVTTNC